MLFQKWDATSSEEGNCLQTSPLPLQHIARQGLELTENQLPFLTKQTHTPKSQLTSQQTPQPHTNTTNNQQTPQPQTTHPMQVYKVSQYQMYSSFR